MLSKTYNGAFKESSFTTGDQWCQLQVVTIQGRFLYRRGNYAKCKRCRRLSSLGVTLCAPTHGDDCPACGNPFIYKLVPARPGSHHVVAKRAA